MIRVGGGYMGIEEFMMYYGQQELQKLQKEEMLKFDPENTVSPILGDEFISDEEQYSHRRSNPLDIDHLKERLKDQSERKKQLRKSCSNSKLMTPSRTAVEQDDRNTVVGIGDVRKALKKNMVTI